MCVTVQSGCVLLGRAEDEVCDTLTELTQDGGRMCTPPPHHHAGPPRHRKSLSVI